MSCVLVLHKRVGGCLFPLYEDTFLSPLTLSHHNSFTLFIYLSTRVLTCFQVSILIFFMGGRGTNASLPFLPSRLKESIALKKLKSHTRLEVPLIPFPLSLSLSLSCGPRLPLATWTSNQWREGPTRGPRIAWMTLVASKSGAFSLYIPLNLSIFFFFR